jgi:D-alanine transaminase
MSKRKAQKRLQNRGTVPRSACVELSAGQSPVLLVYYRSAGFPAGGIIPKDRAAISPNDRGFLFADGVYEVMRSYAGRLFRPDEHLARLAHSLEVVRVPFTDMAGLRTVAVDLLERNELGSSDATVLVQITRGVSPRMVAVPREPLLPTVYVETSRLEPSGRGSAGVSIITVPDIRWSRCDIKAIGLLPNVLARMQAAEAGAAEAVFVRDGMVTEGTHTNLFAVRSGTVLTHAADNYILPGITRSVVLELCRANGIPVAESAITEEQLLTMDELFLSATTAEVTPVVSVNSRPVANGRPGPITLRLQTAFRGYISSTQP